MALKTDYKDYVADGARKYRLTANADGTTGIEDATAYAQQGDRFGAADINATNTAVNAAAAAAAAAQSTAETASTAAAAAQSTADAAMPKAGGTFQGDISGATVSAGSWSFKNISVHTSAGGDTGTNVQRIIMLRK